MMIKKFEGEYQFLSNFWPCDIYFEGLVFPSLEHAYQAAKSELLAVRKLVLKAKTPGEAKRIGRKIALRPNWELIKKDVMTQLIMQKFKIHDGLRAQLLKTGQLELIEGNHWHDNFWGACECSKCNAKPKFNHLGEILMIIREILLTEEKEKWKQKSQK